MKTKSILFAAALLLWAGAAFGQETRGTIAGRVVDASGAVIPGAQVVVTNRAMGTKITLQTNQEGLYQAPFLITGMYDVAVEAQGFKKFHRENVEVRINERLEINAQLEVGASDQSITVTGEVALLNTASGSLGQVIDGRRIADLPISYGNPFELIGLSGGVSFARDPRLDRPFEPTHIVGYAIDGTRANRSDVTLDGAPSTATANPGEVIATYTPPTDIVAEFVVQTATFDASFGQTEGGVTNISIKTGTNNLHGTALYSMTRPTLWANDFFANANNQPRSDFTYDRWGGSAGGPVWIPKLYNGKNRTFFMWGYEGMRDSRPRNNGTPGTPTPAMKSGDFSQLLALGNSYQIYDPFTRTSAPNNRVQSLPFAGNIIPASRLNPVGKAIAGYWPNPTSAGNPDGTNNLQQPDLVEASKYYTHTVRIDHNISEKQRIYGRGSVYRRDSTYNDYFHNLATGTIFQFLARSAVFDDVISLTPSTLLNFRYGYNRFIRNQDGPAEAIGFDITTLGMPKAYNDLISATTRRFPRVDFPTGTYQGTGFTGEFRPVDTHSFNVTLNKTSGKHGFKTGMEFRAYRENDFFFSNDMTGRFNFDTTWTRGPLDNSTSAPNNLGQPFAALLLGLPTSTNSYVSRTADYAEQSTSWGFFFQDDWKVTPKLTLNLGMRWEYEGPLTERYNKSVKGFDADYVPPFAAQAIANYARNPNAEIPASQFSVKGGLNFAGVNGLSRGLYESPKRNFMPRFGFAYQATPKLIVRGGYGIFYGFLGERRGDVVQSGFTRQTPYNPSADNGLTYLATLTNPFPTGILEPLGASQGPMTFQGQAITFFDQKPQMPQMQRWQLGLQREFRGFVAEAAYVGNRGTRIEMTRNLNTTPQQYLGTSAARDQAAIDRLSANVPNPFAGIIPAGAISAFTSSTIARERLLRPYPQFDTVTSTTYDGYSWYHGLQMRLEKRMSKGFTVSANYTYSKFMQAIELLNPSDAKPTEVISDQDYPHRFSMSAILELPFGRGKALLSSAGPVLSRIVGGWQVSTIFMCQSGPAINWNITNPGAFNLQTNAISFNGNVNDIKLAADQQTVGIGSRWFNTDAGFEKVSTRQIDVNRQLRLFPVRFGFLRADSTNNWDITLMKNTRVAEGKSIQFRAEALNAFNHPLFPAPNTTPTAAAFGQVSASTQANYARRIQLGLKFLF